MAVSFHLCKLIAFVFISMYTYLKEYPNEIKLKVSYCSVLETQNSLIRFDACLPFARTLLKT